MRVETSATSLEVWPGVPTTLSVSVFNTADVICGYTFELLGVDREWLRLDYDQLNLFPDDSGTATITLTLPPDFPAGRRNLAVVVQSALDIDDYRVIDFELDVQANLEARLELEPSNVFAGKVGTFGMVITNTGNSWTRMTPAAEEQESKATIDLLPMQVDVPPGEQVTVTAKVRRRRPFIGSPATRIITFRVDGVDEPPQAVGSLTQRPIIGRGLLSLFGLLVALTTFGLVLTNSLGDLVDKTEANDELLASALDQEAEAARLAQAAANPSSINGTVVRESTSGVAPVDNVTVQLYSADDGSQSLGAVATDADGRFAFGPIVAGDYKVLVLGAGFAETWFPDADTFDDAETVTVEIGQDLPTVDVAIRGRPGQISGAVLAPDPSDVVISLIQVQDDQRVATAREVTTDGSGVFVLENIPLNVNAEGRVEPYELVAVKDGFAEERRLVTVNEGEIVDGVRIRLRTGDGRISGTITLDGAAASADELIQVVASAGGDQFSTVTFDNGRYVFRDLPTPALYSITASRDGFSPETRTRRLESAGRITGVDLDLSSDTRTIAGRVLAAATGGPVENALVRITDGQLTLRARTGEDGRYEFRDLSPRDSYTLTASDPDHLDLTQSCPANPAGCEPARPSADFRLRRATSSVFGIVCNRENEGETPRPLGGVTVDLTSATVELTTITADNATSDVDPTDPYDGADCTETDGRLDGFYRFTDVPNGTYTITFTQEGGLPFTQVITVPRTAPVHQTLVNTSTIEVIVIDESGETVPGADVDVYTRASFEADPDGEPDYTAVTGADGTVLFTEVEAPEEYVVIVTYRAPGDIEDQEYSRSFPLRVGESKSETITVRRDPAVPTTTTTTTTPP